MPVIEIPEATFHALLRRAEGAGKDVPAFLAERYGGAHVEITDLDELVRMASEPRERTFTIHGQPRKIRYRALSADESAEVDKVTNAVIAPRDAKGFINDDDPVYKQNLQLAQRISRVKAFEYAVLSFKLKGETEREKADFLYKKLPPGVINEIWRAILELTSDPIENALFS